MKPVDQTTFGFPGGNCFSACVASLLELPLDDVPYFMGTIEDGDEWFDRFETWLKPLGFWPVMFKISIAEDNDWRPSGLHILSGKSPRAKTDEMHSVLADGEGKVIHDPHPSRDGLVMENLDVVMFVPLDPAMLRRWARAWKLVAQLYRRRYKRVVEECGECWELNAKRAKLLAERAR